MYVKSVILFVVGKGKFDLNLLGIGIHRLAKTIENTECQIKNTDFNQQMWKCGMSVVCVNMLLLLKYCICILPFTVDLI